LYSIDFPETGGLFVEKANNSYLLSEAPKNLNKAPMTSIH